MSAKKKHMSLTHVPQKRPACRVEDHSWMIHLEGGSVHLECLDAHSEEECAKMEGTPGCYVASEPEVISTDFGPLDLKWEKESHGWETPNDYDYWLEVDPDRNLSRAQLALYAALPMFEPLDEMFEGLSKSEAKTDLITYLGWLRRVLEKGLKDD